MGTTYKQSYSNFIGADMSSDPAAVSRNRLAYCVNMWRDYESEQGAAVETFPGFRRVAPKLGKLHGLYSFRTRDGRNYAVAHAGGALYAFEIEALAAGEYAEDASSACILASGLADNDSSGFIYNNNLHILDGQNYWVVKTIGSGGAQLTAGIGSGYVPTTWYNGKPYEQRNMLTDNCIIREDSANFVALDEKDVIRAPQLIDHIFANNRNDILVKGFKDGWNGSFACCYDPMCGYIFDSDSFSNCYGLKKLVILCGGMVTFGANTLRYHYGLREVEVWLFDDYDYEEPYVTIEQNAFRGNPSNVKITIHYESTIATGVTINNSSSVPDANITLVPFSEGDEVSYPDYIELTSYMTLYDPINNISNITSETDGVGVLWAHQTETRLLGSRNQTVISKIYICNAIPVSNIRINAIMTPGYFGTAGDKLAFSDANKDYSGTTNDAIDHCTKCAVYDGRIFLTGNPALPNTVFYSQRNLTGANDPLYFGVYNYFNDGEGNTPNVDLLSTPSMLMVIKGDTVQDGSVYYHVGTDNTDSNSKDLLPRIYPATRGAAGIGSAGGVVPSSLSCNFLDDPVFLSKRGVEGVSKEAVNLERTIGHRSSNIDRLLIKEDLSRASLAEWKGYLAICCNGHIYLADSRYRTQHADGSYQYEWYYLEGIGTYPVYYPRWGEWLSFYPIIQSEAGDRTLDEFVTAEGDRVGDVYSIRERGDVKDVSLIMTAPSYHPTDSSVVVDLLYVEEEGKRYLVDVKGDEKLGSGELDGAQRLTVIGERLIFGTGNGDICIVNTDMRGKSVDGRAVESDMIDRSFYSFNGVAYLSGCSLRLDDCSQQTMTKATVCGSTAARLKMMPGSHCTVNVTFNGRDWQYLGEAHSSRFDFSDLQFSNLSFAENENNVVIFPEISRGWVQKQYYFYSDRYEAPFGLYELSYLYYASGKIRY